jgi:hypothetical protein
MSYITVLLSVASLLEARAAINGSVTGGLERKLSLASALGASSDEVLALASLSILFLVAASLAALRLVLKALFSIELLLACCEYKFLSAISACEGYVFINDLFSVLYFYFVFTHVFFLALNYVNDSLFRAPLLQRGIYKISLQELLPLIITQYISELFSDAVHSI